MHLFYINFFITAGYGMLHPATRSTGIPEDAPINGLRRLFQGQNRAMFQIEI